MDPKNPSGMNWFGAMGANMPDIPKIGVSKIGVGGYGMTLKPANTSPGLPAPAAKMAASSASEHLPDWARSDVVKGGGSPKDFGMIGNSIVSNKPMSQDFRPGVTVPGTSVAPGRLGVQAPANLAPAPANVPTIMPMQSEGGSSIAPSPASATSSPSAPRAAQGDPYSKIGVLDQINANPERRTTALALNGATAGEIAALPTPGRPGLSPFNAANYESAGAANPETAPTAAVLGGSTPFHEKAAVLARIPGIQDPSSPHRQLWNAFMAAQQAKGQEFADEMAQYGLGSPDGTPTHGTWIGQLLGDFGGDEAARARNLEFRRNMAALGQVPVTLGGNQ